MRLTSKKRGYYRFVGDVIATPGKQTATKKWATPAYNQEVSLHELVHRVQHSAYGRRHVAQPPQGITGMERLNEITQELYKVRTTSPQGVRSAAKHIEGYGANEVFRDGFPPWPHEYLAKEYGDVHSSEVLTMGVQAILGPGAPHYYAAQVRIQQDKQLMQFLLGVLAGI